MSRRTADHRSPFDKLRVSGIFTAASHHDAGNLVRLGPASLRASPRSQRDLTDGNFQSKSGTTIFPVALDVA